MVEDAPVEIAPEPVNRTPISIDNLPPGAVRIPTDAVIVPQPIGLGNRSAVRAALPAGISSLLFSAMLAPLALPLMIAGGMFAVFLYRRRTGQILSILNGARLGWLTGLFLFLILLVALTALIATQPALYQQALDQLISQGRFTAEDVQVIRGPGGIFAMIAAAFVTSTIPTAIGGLLGATLFKRTWRS